MQDLTTTSIENINNIIAQGALYYHKGVSKKLGGDSALILAYLIDKCLENGGADFHYTIPQLRNDIGVFGLAKIRKRLHELIESGIVINKGLKGCPPKQYYSINFKALQF